MATPVDKPTPTIEEIEQIKKKKLEKKLEKKRKREERRLAPGIVPTENPGSCNYFMPQKNRFCNIAPKPGGLYCPAHLAVSSGQRRITCPADPTHTIYEANLKAHLKKCSIHKKPKFEGVHIEKNLNAGSDYEDEDDQPLAFDESDSENEAMAEQPDTTELEETLKDPMCVVDIPLAGIKKRNRRLKKSKLAELSFDELQAFMVKIEKAYESLDLKIKPLSEAATPVVHTMNTESNSNHQPAGGVNNLKHGTQHDAILSKFVEYNVWNKNNIFCEFGSGKGTLSYLIHEKLPGVDNVLIDRAKFRFKADRCVADNDGAMFKRLLADIKDLNLGKVPELQERANKQIISFSKHLCGAATDLTVRCLKNASGLNVDFLLVALCCHHRCDLRHYLNKQYLSDLGFTETDFQFLIAISGWATSGAGWEKKSAELSASTLQPSRKEAVGRKAKRILDKGRMIYLEKMGYKTVLAEYCEKSVSPENVLLIAVKTDH